MDTRIPPLVNALKLVAADFSDQIAALPEFVVHADEVALNFDDAYQVIASTEDLIPKDIMLLLQVLDVHFSAMSDDKSLWTTERLRNHGAWEKSRQLARRALSLWGIEQGPPGTIGSYVQGL